MALVFMPSGCVNIEKALKKLQALVDERERELQRQRATEQLYMLACQIYRAGMQAQQERRLEKIKKLLAQGAQVNVCDEHQCTPLYWAVFHNYYDLVKLLLEHGADVHVGNIYKTTPLHLAIVQGNQAIINILITYRASLYIPDKWGDEPIDLVQHQSTTGRYIRKLNLLKACGPIIRLLSNYMPDYLAQRIVASYIYPDS